MCGIVGALSLNKPSINVDYAKPMADKIAHRGPDDAGIFDFISKYLGNSWEHIELDFMTNTSKCVKNRFYYKKFGSSKEHLCFAGHIDVVPPGEGWDSDPFEPLEKDGMIYARGTQDMKSGVAAMVESAKNLEYFPGTLSILLTSDEEGEAKFGTKYVLEELKKLINFQTSQ